MLNNFFFHLFINLPYGYKELKYRVNGYNRNQFAQPSQMCKLIRSEDTTDGQIL